MEIDETKRLCEARQTMPSDSVTQAEYSGKINSDTTLEQTSSESCDTPEELSEEQKIQDSISSPCHHYLMTTRELQLYWLKEKHESKPVRLLFEIPSTRIAEDFLSKFVMYKIVIIKTGSFDENKVFIERRYSDFEKLHRNLLKDFKEEMEDVLFPKKILKGNLTEELISKRMLAFKGYLAELYNIKCVQKSRKFIDFFINPEIEEGYSCLRGGQFGRAMEIFQQVACLQEKLAQHCLVSMVPALCALVVCHKDLENTEKAYDLGMKALAILERHPRHKYYIPLLDTLISLAYKLSKEFVSLQEQLEKGERQMNIHGMKLVTLKELVVQECVE